MSDVDPTYEQVARWLPKDVREAIEATVPCIGGGEHDWQYRSIDVSRMESAFTTTEEWWSCRLPGCNRTVRTDPAQVS